MRLTRAQLRTARNRLVDSQNQRIDLPEWLENAKGAIIKAIDWVDANLSDDGKYIKLPGFLQFKKWRQICDLLYAILQQMGREKSN